MTPGHRPGDLTPAKIGCRLINRQQPKQRRRMKMTIEGSRWWWLLVVIAWRLQNDLEKEIGCKVGVMCLKLE